MTFVSLNRPVGHMVELSQGWASHTVFTLEGKADQTYCWYKINYVSQIFIEDRGDLH